MFSVRFLAKAMGMMAGTLATLWLDMLLAFAVDVPANEQVSLLPPRSMNLETDAFVRDRKTRAGVRRDGTVNNAVFAL